MRLGVKKIKKNQRFRRKETSKVVREQMKEERKERIHHGLALFFGVITFSIVTGIIGFFVGLYNDFDGGMGFLIGFLAPLIVLFFWFVLLDLKFW